MSRQPVKASPAGEPVITDEVWKVAELKPDPQNAGRHSEAQVSEIVMSIERFGFIDKLGDTPERPADRWRG
jgi:hypothetical protein